MRAISKLSVGPAVAAILLIAYVPNCHGDDLQKRLGAISSPLIIQGKDTDIEKIPYQVAIEKLTIHSCGGSIVTDTWVVTSAHCVDPDTSGNYGIRIRAGSTTAIPIVGSGGIIHEISWTEIHPEFNHRNLDFDCALVKVSKKFNFSSRIQPIKVPMSEIYIDYTGTATVSGWGKTSVGSLWPCIKLQSAQVPLLTRNKCLSILDAKGFRYYISRRMLCAGGKGSDTSLGDSGGPLVQNKQLIGIVSWGMSAKASDSGKLPSVYTNVLRFEIRTFINEHTGA